MPTNQTTIKLQAFLAHAGVASRRKSEEFIERGQVTVNGRKATIGQRVNPQTDQIAFKGKPIKLTDPNIYLLINKPLGLISTTQDELKRDTVLKLVPKELRQYRLYPVGRLDQDSEGLMLLTNDGDLAYRLTHPKFQIPKTYHVLLDRMPTAAALNHLRDGVRLREGFTSPAEVEHLDTGDQPWFSITIKEGRYHQVRRMMERVGYKVQQLIRVQMGRFTLDQLAGKTHVQLDEKTVKTSLRAK
jgi:23S rRNA pseudouridine2605 synthase